MKLSGRVYGAAGITYVITSRNVGIVPNDPRGLVVEIGRDVVKRARYFRNNISSSRVRACAS